MHMFTSEELFYLSMSICREASAEAMQESGLAD